MKSKFPLYPLLTHCIFYLNHISWKSCCQYILLGAIQVGEPVLKLKQQAHSRNSVAAQNSSHLGARTLAFGHPPAVIDNVLQLLIHTF